MNKKILLASIFVSAFIVLLLLNYFGAFKDFNNSFNKNPDKSCVVDTDCVIKRVNCAPCSCGEPVNVNWNVQCPFSRGKFPTTNYMCEMCPQEATIKCIDNKCARINT